MGHSKSAGIIGIDRTIKFSRTGMDDDEDQELNDDEIQAKREEKEEGEDNWWFS